MIGEDEDGVVGAFFGAVASGGTAAPEF